MKQLTESLQVAQQKADRSPCLQVRVTNKISGVTRLDWSRLYTGTESEYVHAAAVPGDGSLIRVRVTPVADSRKLYYQRTAAPDPGSDFSSWTYANQTDVVAVAAAACGAEVSIVWVKTNREIRRIKSADYGVNWGSPELIDYTPTTAIYGLAAAYKPNGDPALFFADASTLYIKKCLSGQWQAKTAWNKTTGNLSGAASIYDGDWNLLVTGKDTSGNYKLWSLVHGDGGDVAAGTWSGLKEIAAAPSGGDFAYKQPFLDKTDVYRACYIESFTGVEAYSRPYFSYIVPGTKFCDAYWREPYPFNLASDYGLATVHSAEDAWLSTPSGVWRAGAQNSMLDVSADIVKAESAVEKTSGSLMVALNNEQGQYLDAGQGSQALLVPGSDVEFNPGYVTARGAEYSGGQVFSLETLEFARSGGNAVLALRCIDAWSRLAKWQARQQFRWNKTADDFCLTDILAVILGRAGLKLSVTSGSAAVSGFYPDFTVNPGSSGREVALKLLSYVPDRLFFEGNTGYLVNPQTSDAPVYTYGAAHDILESRFLQAGPNLNRVQAEGWDASAGHRIITESFDWENIAVSGERYSHLNDKNLNSVAEAGQRGAAVLRNSALDEDTGSITIPVNCGQQLYDVIALTDAAAGLEESLGRITGINLRYNPSRAEYLQRLKLGKV